MRALRREYRHTSRVAVVMGVIAVACGSGSGAGDPGADAAGHGGDSAAAGESGAADGGDAAANGGVAVGGAAGHSTLSGKGGDSVSAAGAAGVVSDAAGSGGEAAGAPKADTLPALVLEDGSFLTRVGPAGGTVSGPLGLELVIPAGALSSNVSLKIGRDSSAAPAFPPADIAAAGSPFELTPHGTVFAGPIQIRVPFNTAWASDDAIPTLYKAELGGSFSELPAVLDGDRLVAEISDFSWVIPASQASRPRRLYVPVDADSIQAFAFGKAGLASTPMSSAPSPFLVQGVVVHPSGRFAYVSSRGHMPGQGSQRVSSYTIDSLTGAISGPNAELPSSTISTAGAPVSPVIDPSGKFLYVANFQYAGESDDVSVFRIDGVTGNLSGPVSTAPGGNHAPAMGVAFEPTGHFAYVLYGSGSAGSALGANASVRAYTVNPTDGTLTFSSLVQFDQLPTSMVIDPFGKHLYVGCYGYDEVRSFDIHPDGSLQYRSTASLESHPGDMAIGAHGKYLYAGSDLFMVSYAINGDGALTQLAKALRGRNVASATDPDGDFLFEYVSGRISSFAVDASSGSLSPRGVLAPYVSFDTRPLVPPKMGVSGPRSIYVADAAKTSVCTLGCLFKGNSNGGGGGGGNTPPPNPLSILEVTRDNFSASRIKSTPAGIDCGAPAEGDFCASQFASTQTVELCATIKPGVVYDIAWQGACSGSSACVTVPMNGNKYCHLDLQPHIPPH